MSGKIGRTWRKGSSGFRGFFTSPEILGEIEGIPGAVLSQVFFTVPKCLSVSQVFVASIGVSRLTSTWFFFFFFFFLPSLTILLFAFQGRSEMIRTRVWTTRIKTFLELCYEGFGWCIPCWWPVRKFRRRRRRPSDRAESNCNEKNRDEFHTFDW